MSFVVNMDTGQTVKATVQILKNTDQKVKILIKSKKYCKIVFFLLIKCILFTAKSIIYTAKSIKNTAQMYFFY